MNLTFAYVVKQVMHNARTLDLGEFNPDFRDYILKKVIFFWPNYYYFTFKKINLQYCMYFAVLFWKVNKIWF